MGLGPAGKCACATYLTDGYTSPGAVAYINIQLSTSLAPRPGEWNEHTSGVKSQPDNIRIPKTMRTEPLGGDGLGNTNNTCKNIGATGEQSVTTALRPLMNRAASI